MKLTTEQKAKVRAAEAVQSLEKAQLEIVLLKALIEEKDAEIALLKGTYSKPEAEKPEPRKPAVKKATKVEKEA
jgi:hypothetical protein